LNIKDGSRQLSGIQLHIEDSCMRFYLFMHFDEKAQCVLSLSLLSVR
jgi:hypothetical protein